MIYMKEIRSLQDCNNLQKIHKQSLDHSRYVANEIQLGILQSDEDGIQRNEAML